MNKKGELSLKQGTDGSKEFTGRLYQGIFPPPEIMKEYQEIDPGLPGRLIKWTEDESTHRRLIEKKVMRNTLLTIIVGNICGLLSILGLSVLSYLFMINGHPGEGKWIAISMASVVGIFVLRKYMTKNN